MIQISAIKPLHAGRKVFAYASKRAEPTEIGIVANGPDFDFLAGAIKTYGIKIEKVTPKANEPVSIILGSMGPAVRTSK